ncbi:hypothetical protein CHLRE_17g711900v5 [Chlamydomonas reinhardtii]|uniref:Sulfotransferase n=1 Tax=Chlamydomonas reinhardtii TaxID=3055 RepID=A0A2K3CPP3_CHLRE|nr:uncharacterized protein CHLRE_17g711900v5 [Chlamydomonas reinhardtii]PNW70247.1 hypothetical protein CHLRE_17g711900v5 [Chlamydomonas reinhardtii]
MKQRYGLGTPSVLALVILALLAQSTLAQATEPLVQKALELFFGNTANATADGELLAMLDVAITMPLLKLNGTLKKLPELDEHGASDCVRSLIQFGEEGRDSTAAWAQMLGAFYTSRVANITTGPPDMFGLRQAFPVIRRVAMAQLVKAWLTRWQRQVPSELEAPLQQLFREFYEAHRVVAIRKGIMEYFHISKAGGTSWCHAAKNNGCRAQVYDSAYICQIGQFDDRVRWLNNSFHAQRTGRGARWGTWGRPKRATDMTTCEQRFEFAAALGYQYFSNEYTLHEGFEDPDNVGTCPQFFNVILVRDPLKRLLSHLKFVTMQMKWDYRNNTLFHNTFTGTDSAFWEEFGPVLVDNYMLRGMLGETVYHYPIGGIGAKQVAHGRAILQQYDLVVDLEAGHDVLDDVIELGVGWPHTLREIHDKDSTKAAKLLNLTYEDYLPTDIQRLFEKQGPDVEFYRFGRVLVRLDTLLFHVARGLGVQPLAATRLAELAERGPEAIKCGLLRRGPRQLNSTEREWQPNEYADRVNAEMKAAREEAHRRFAQRAARAKASKLAKAAAAAAQAAEAAANAVVAAADAVSRQQQGGTRRRALLSVDGEGVEAKAAAAGPSWGQLEGRKEEAGRDGGGVRRAMPGMMEALGRTGARQLRRVRRRVSGEAGLDRRLALELGLEGVAEEGKEQDEGEDYGVHVGHGGLYDVYEEL